MTAPVLSGDALAAVQHRGSHMQIIASAGSGKTEVVAQRFIEFGERDELVLDYFQIGEEGPDGGKQLAGKVLQAESGLLPAQERRQPPLI